MARRPLPRKLRKMSPIRTLCVVDQLLITGKNYVANVSDRPVATSVAAVYYTALCVGDLLAGTSLRHDQCASARYVVGYCSCGRGNASLAIVSALVAVAGDMCVICTEMAL